MIIKIVEKLNLLHFINHMYDERTRQQDDLWASLAYAQEEVMGLGIEHGKE